MLEDYGLNWILQLCLEYIKSKVLAYQESSN